MARAPDRWLLVRAALAEESRAALVSLRRLLGGPRLARAPDRLVFAPQDLRSADPAIAAEMAAGMFVFAGRMAQPTSGSPFRIDPPSEAWAEQLYGFGWLRHLRAADGPSVRSLARALVGEAIGPLRRDLGRGLPRRTAVVARRTISLLAHSPLLITGADQLFYRRYLQAIGRDAAALERDLRGASRPLDRLAAAIGLCVAGLSCNGLEGALRRGTRALGAELAVQIRPDGGHIGRDPATLVDLLVELMPLRLLYGSRQVQAPAALDPAIARMLAMLRLFRHGSGDLALFNGMGQTPLGELATLFAHDTDRVALHHAAPSGFDRLEAGGTVVIVDTGAPPPLPASGTAHAGCLSFEMSAGLHRLVVNQGAPARQGAAWARAREGRAHSTLVLGGQSAATLLDLQTDGRAGWPRGFVVRRFGPVLVGGPQIVGSALGADAAGNLVLTAHQDGYRVSHGALHTRRLRLSAAGDSLDGQDRLTFASDINRGDEAARVHFHLHPSVEASLEEGGERIRLDVPGGERWVFGADNVTPSLESSVFHAVSEGRRPSRQIVLSVRCLAGTRRVDVRWAFRRVAATAPAEPSDTG